MTVYFQFLDQTWTSTFSCV